MTNNQGCGFATVDTLSKAKRENDEFIGSLMNE